MTKRVKILLPESEEAYELTIWLDGKQVREPIIIQPGVTEIEVELTGVGRQTYILKKDGVEMEEKLEVNFDNG